MLSSPDLGILRAPGPGFGNLLFPISRALIGSRTLGGKYVEPTLRQIKIGTILRGERDTRTYGRIFHHRSAEDWRNWLLARFGRTVPETADEFRDGDCILYSGLGDYFHPLKGHAETVRDYLNTRVRMQGKIAADYDLALHVRRGDFGKPAEGENPENRQIAFGWYQEVLEYLRAKQPRRKLEVYLFTDAAGNEAHQMAEQLDAKLDPGKNAAVSILNLSRADTIITSRSTFSMWGVYLGNATAVWHRDFDLDRYWPTRTDSDIRF